MSNEFKMPEEVKYAHVITIVYLFIAGYSDGEFSDSEMATIKTRISNWMGDDATNADVNKLILEACDWYDSLNEDQLKNTVVNSLPILKEKFNEDALKLLITDLIKIAEADGTVTQSEFGNVKVITEALGFSF